MDKNKALDLLNLCNFSLKDKFKLIYRATRDGFSSKNFHNNCDGIAKTLVLIKVKENDSVFGGYTSVPWDMSNKYKQDKNAFVFSLINTANRPIKINQNCDVFSIYCDSSYGPAFGVTDFCISSDSNINHYSSSSLSNTYKHPDFLYNSDEAKFFLAGSYNFTTTEIEVYHLE